MVNILLGHTSRASLCPPDLLLVCPEGHVWVGRAMLAPSLLTCLLGTSTLEDTPATIILAEHTMEDLVQLLPATTVFVNDNPKASDSTEVFSVCKVKDEQDLCLKRSEEKASDGELFEAFEVEKETDISNEDKSKSKEVLEEQVSIEKKNINAEAYTNTSTITNSIRRKLDEKLDGLIEKLGDRWFCKTCGHQESQLADLKYHVETHFSKKLRIKASVTKTKFISSIEDQSKSKEVLEEQGSIEKKNIYAESDTNTSTITKSIRRKESQLSDLKYHVETHFSKEPRIKASRTKTKFISKKAKMLEEMFEESERQYVCTLCNYTNEEKQGIIDHVKSHFNIKNICDVCDKQCTTRKALHKHLTYNHANTMHVCDMCGMGDMTKSQLTRHIAMQHKRQSKSCDICGRVVKDGRTLERHMEKVHFNPPTAKLYTCEFCGKTDMPIRSYAGHKRRIHLDFFKVDLKTKVAVIKARNEEGATTQGVATAFRLGLSTVQLILRKKEKHLNEYENQCKEEIG